MPLSETELQAEDLAQLRRLAQSPGWALLKARWLKSVARSESEKASLLRDSFQGRETRVSYLQGKIDGYAETLLELDRYMQELAQEPSAASPY